MHSKSKTNSVHSNRKCLLKKKYDKTFHTHKRIACPLVQCRNIKVQPLIDTRPPARILWIQGTTTCRSPAVHQIRADGARLPKHKVTVHQRWQTVLWIYRTEIGPQLFTRRQIDVAHVDVQAEVADHPEDASRMRTERIVVEH